MREEEKKRERGKGKVKSNGEKITEMEEAGKRRLGDGCEAC